MRKLVRGQYLAFPYFILGNWRIGFSNVLPLQRSSCFKTLCEVAFSCSWNNSVVIKCRHVRRDANHRGSSFKLWIQKRPQRLGHLVFPGDPTGLLLRLKIRCYRRYHQKKWWRIRTRFGSHSLTKPFAKWALHRLSFLGYLGVLCRAYAINFPGKMWIN